MMTVEVAQDQKQSVNDITVIAPEWLAAEDLVVVRAPSEGRAFISIRDAQPGVSEFAFKVGDSIVTKPVVIGGEAERPRVMQPERVGGFWEAWIWPAEAMISADSPIQRIAIEGEYPARHLGFFPDGILGILIAVIVYSFIAGLAILKPLGVTI